MSIEAFTKRNLVKVKPDTTAGEAAKQMAMLDIGVSVVADESGIVGLFSERDLLKRVIAQDRPVITPVHEVMTRDLITVDITKSPKEAIAVMLTNHVRHLPVTEGGKIVGILSIRDLMSAIVLESDAKPKEETVHFLK